jgi:putative ABC transport system permease protein
MCLEQPRIRRRTLPRLESFWIDLRQAVHSTRKSPAFTAAAVAMLTIGIAVNAIVFSVTNAALFKGFPLVDANDRIVYISNNGKCCVSYPDFEEWRAQTKTLDDMALVHGLGITLTDGAGFPEDYTVTEVTSNTFGLVRQKPILGRDFTPADEIPGAVPVVILRYGFWERRFAKDPGIVGRIVRLNGVPTTVIGVMPRGFSFPQNQDLWVPLVPTPEIRRRDRRNTWFVFGRLSDGATVESARADMDTIGERLARAWPATNAALRPEVRTFEQFFIGENAALIYKAMVGAVGFVLLIACANLANLLLARTAGRSREIALRAALGASRWRIVRQLMIESITLAGLGGFFAWWLLRFAVPVYALVVGGSGISDELGSWFDEVLDYSIDYRVVLYLVAITVGTGMVFGLAPAVRLSRFDINETLKEGGRGGLSDRHGRLSSLLVIVEVALAVILLAGAGLMIRSFMNVYRAEPGFRNENLLTAHISLSTTRYQDISSQVSFYDRVLKGLEATPGVESIAIADAIPGSDPVLLGYEIAGATPVDEQQRPRVGRLLITSSYFRTLETPVMTGRDFTDLDAHSSAPVVLVNQRFASEHWPPGDAIGRRLRLTGRQGAGEWMTVIGIAPNITQNRMTRQLDPLVYLPYPERPALETPRAFGDRWLLIRTSTPPDNVASSFRREVTAVDSEQSIGTGPVPLIRLMSRSYQFKAFTTTLFLVFAALALLLAAIGLYAVIAYSVSRRTQEMGIRLAIGATSGDILTLVMRQGMLPLGIGLVIGLIGSLGINQLLQSQLVHVSAADPLSHGVATLVLIASAALGCWIPARRAMRVDPLVALRQP